MKTLREYKTVQERRSAIEKETGVLLTNISSFTLDEAVVSTRNCENMIGITQIPLGIAGPLRLADSFTVSKVELLRAIAHNYYLPLATTEGALVASVNRGCKAITESGGATVAVEKVGVTRGPVFKTVGISESLKLKKWLSENLELLNREAQKTSHHLTLTKIGSRVVGKNVYSRFYFDTQDAMGMNMVTIAVSSIIRIIELSTKSKCIAVAGNFDIDKKPAWLNSVSGRGRRVWAEVTIPESVLKTILKTTAQKIYEVWLAKCMIGSAMSGSIGFNAQFANIIAALFIATGQDPGHIVEGSVGITTCEKLKENLYISIYLPDLMVGTVGGGTGLATQKEALELLGVKNVEQFAGIVGGAVLAGEISLLASLAEGTLARAHQTLARGKNKI